MRPKPEISAEFDDHRDRYWRREGTRQIETALEAERFIEQVGFASCLTDSRRPGPSLYIAVCGRRDAVMPRNVQKDPEASLTWTLKDELMGRGRVYYAKLARGKSTFLAPRMIPFFHAVWGMRRADEERRLSKPARAVLRVLRREWEMSTADLRRESRLTDRQAFTRAMDELQAAMIVIPIAAYYQPAFTYIWALGVGRFPDALRKRVSRPAALREIARCFLAGAGMTVPGELARVTGLSRPEAGLGNRALVAEGFAADARQRGVSPVACRCRRGPPIVRTLARLVSRHYPLSWCALRARWLQPPPNRVGSAGPWSSSNRRARPANTPPASPATMLKGSRRDEERDGKILRRRGTRSTRR